MITEEQARTLFAGHPAGSIDAYAVLRAGRRARVRRRALVASGGVAVAAGTAALAVASTGSERASVVTPATTSPAASPTASARPSPTTTPLRVEKDQIGDAVLIGSYVADGERRDVVAYFTRHTDFEGTTRVLLCDAAVGPGGRPEPLAGAGCQGPALPEPGHHFAIGAMAPGTSGDDGSSGAPVLGPGVTYSVVGTSVTRGGAYDDTGAFHEGRVLGIGDPSLPARLLVVEMPGGRWFRGYRLWDAAGTLLADEGPWPASGEPGPRASESPFEHGPE